MELEKDKYICREALEKISMEAAAEERHIERCQNEIHRASSNYINTNRRFICEKNELETSQNVKRTKPSIFRFYFDEIDKHIVWIAIRRFLLIGFVLFVGILVFHLSLESDDSAVASNRHEPLYVILMLAGLLVVFIAVFICTLKGCVLDSYQYWKNEYEQQENLADRSGEMLARMNADVERYFQIMVQVQEEKTQEMEIARNLMLVYESVRAYLHTQLEEIEATLLQTYDADIIHPDYRSITPISMFINYLEKERCLTLTGINGAYDKYEEEVRDGLILSDFSAICTDLESVRHSMGTLYRTINSARESIDALLAELRNANSTLQDSIRPDLEANMENQNRLQALNAQIISDRTHALASIEQQKLDAIRRANMEMFGHE